MNCPKCGSTMTNEDRFCGRCGTGLTSLSGHRGVGSTRQGMVSFSDAVKLGFQGYFKFNGRSTRAEFWWWILFEWVTVLPIAFIDGFLGMSGILYWISVFGLLTPLVAVTVRRLHDTNKPGWWALVSFVPLVGWVMIFYCVQPSDMRTNNYGPNPSEAI